ncbi:MAG TPA: DUF6111 family protein [Methylocella sp.]|nr:DUF6111 family protein [Methylocella sp.]
MWRIVLDPLFLFLLPFLVYALFLGLGRKYPFTFAYWTKGAVSTLTLLGLAVAVLGMLVIGLWAPRHEGAYIPAHIENGRLVPGRLQ